MKSRILNIEIGRHIVKVCTTRKKGTGYQISDVFLFSVPDGIVEDGQILNPAALGWQLASELASHHISAENAVFTLTSGTKIASRIITLPPAKDETLKSVAATNADEYLPIDVSRYRISSTVLDQSDTESRLHVVAVPNSLADGYISMADTAGLNVTALDFSGNSQYQVLRDLSSSGVTMYATIEDSSAVVTFMENGRLLMQRCLAIGGDEMISAYLNAAGWTSGQYIQALEALSVSADKPEADVETTAYTAGLVRLVTGIARSTDFFTSSNSADISRVVLMGSCCHLAGLKEMIADRLELPTLWLEEVSGMHQLANSILGISMFISCLGSRIAPMGFLPQSYAPRRRKAAGKSESHYGLLVLAGCAVLAFILCSSVLLQHISKKSELVSLEQQTEALAYTEDIYQSYVSCMDSAGNLQAFTNLADTPNAHLSAFLEELEQKMPTDAIFLSAACTADGVSMTIETPGFEEASVVLSQLRSFESLESVSAGTMTESTDSAGISMVSFTVSAVYSTESAEVE